MENKSGWTLQNLHCNTAALQSRYRKHFPCFYYQVMETQEDVRENMKAFRTYKAIHKGKGFQLFQFFPNMSNTVSITLCNCGKMFTTSFRK